MIGVIVEKVICGILVQCDFDKAWKIGEHLDIKNCSCKKHLILWACEDEVLNETGPRWKTLVTRPQLLIKK